NQLEPGGCSSAERTPRTARMPTTQARLTDASVQAMRPEAREYEAHDTLAEGLRLRVGPDPELGRGLRGFQRRPAALRRIASGMTEIGIDPEIWTVCSIMRSPRGLFGRASFSVPQARNASASSPCNRGAKRSRNWTRPRTWTVCGVPE